MTCHLPFNRKWFVPLLLLAAFSNVFGQTIDGSIVGSVLDPGSSGIANATVQAENVATGVKSSTTTDAVGAYRLPNLSVGTYKLTATAAGFAPRQIDGVAVSLSVTSTVNVIMQVGSVTTTVEVTTSTAVIDTTTAQISNTYTSRLAADLPVSANTAGGVLNLSLLGAGIGSGGGVGVGTGPSVGGQRPRNNSFTIEGVDNNRKDVTGPIVRPPNDAVAEFTLLQNQFSAEFGHSSGGQFNTV
ncbi:MAG: carboxypeptidase-like regulatory domain-containing protein, partial [Acidobacteriota bacterium]